MLLIDGSNLLHRQLHVSSNDFEAVDGHKTGGIGGFFKSLAFLSRKYKYGKGFVVAWDKGSSAYRRSLYPEYKQGRSLIDKLKGADEDSKKFVETYVWSRDKLHNKLLPLTNIMSVQVPEVEADDIISWVVRHVETPGVKVIVSTDTDYYQLIDDNVEVLNPISREVYDKDRIIEEWELISYCYKEHITLIRALEGDPSDNLPGVRGVGRVNAARISKAVLLGEELSETNKKDKAYLDSVDDVSLFKKVIDLNAGLPVEYESQIEDALRIQANVELEVGSELDLADALNRLDLRKTRELCPTIAEADNAGAKESILAAV